MGASDMPKIPSDAAKLDDSVLPTTGSNRSPTRNRQSGTVREKPRLPWLLLKILHHRDGAMPDSLGKQYCPSVARSGEICCPRKRVLL